METKRFMVTNGWNDITPQQTLHVIGYRFENFIVKKSDDIIKANMDYIYVHSNVLHNNNIRTTTKTRQAESSTVIEYLPLASDRNVKSWKRTFADFQKVSCEIETPILLFLSLDGQTDSKLEFSAVLSLKLK